MVCDSSLIIAASYYHNTTKVFLNFLPQGHFQFFIRKHHSLFQALGCDFLLYLPMSQFQRKPLVPKHLLVQRPQVWTNSLSVPPSVAPCKASSLPAGMAQPYCRSEGKYSRNNHSLKVCNTLHMHVVKLLFRSWGKDYCKKKQLINVQWRIHIEYCLPQNVLDKMTEILNDNWKRWCRCAETSMHQNKKLRKCKDYLKFISPKSQNKVVGVCRKLSYWWHLKQ